MPAFSKIAKAMETFRLKLNQAENKTLRVDEEEIVLSRFDGSSKQKYRRHKDSYIHDENNQIHGSKLRKLSLVIFLNDNFFDVRSLQNT